ncbi:DUF5107 domain-containing protein [Mitsuokella multacida]|uniref:DUF5107 domain-containing protein n=1 Tax=Mitsuokella multacida TaxID=52226 RepID=UPI0039F5C736
MTSVRVWEEDVTIPTYKIHPAEKAPLFLEKRAYQGSSGKVYPFPVVEKIDDHKEPVSYRAVYLENEYLKVMILPQLGGRIQRALDKTNQYDFIYYNEVIKPALVGLAGPWISGGIEFNWPQHHRPSTFAPTDYTLKQHADGSATVYISEVDKMYGTKSLASISLYPGKSYIEIRGQFYNPTDLPQTFLWWANPAVSVNENTFSVFPPDVNAVFDHGKRAVSTFPIATGEYYKVDYSAGVDISRYKNLPVPTSYMAAHSDFNFMGNYDEGRQAGLLHVADHHISPGKKQWTWGCGDFGKSWDRNLTDENGPYIELMTGVYTDNQPDFSWLKPQEEKSFVQYFMPYKGVGRVCNATKEAALSIDEEKGTAQLKIYATAAYPNAAITVKASGDVIFSAHADLSPQSFYTDTFSLKGHKLTDCTIDVKAEDGHSLVSYDVYKPHLQEIPQPQSVLGNPSELKSTEELYLAGLHLEQYRHATYEPADYYREGLRRDPTDIRLNSAYGKLLMRRGHIKEAIEHFRAAIRKQTWRNPNPYAGEGYFNLGLSLFLSQDFDKAYDAFFKAVWSAETQRPAFYWLACLEARKGNYAKALDFAQQSLIRNWHNMKARTLIAAMMRLLHQDNQQFLAESLAIDPLYQGCRYEEALRTGKLDEWKAKMRGEAHNYLVLAQSYMHAGLYQDAVSILAASTDTNPLLDYYTGYAEKAAGHEKEALAAFEAAEQKPLDYCFPNHVEEIFILQTAIEMLPQAPSAHYLLGNLLYDKKQYEQAASEWQAAIDENPQLAMAYRNLALAKMNKQHDSETALKLTQHACQLVPKYPRFWLELDQLLAKLNKPIAERLQIMEEHPAVTMERDDLRLRYITLLNASGQYDKALHILKETRFHPWEGGEGKVAAQYKISLHSLAVKALAQGKAEEAIPLLEAALTYPDNLGEGKLPNVPDHETWYELGRAYEMLHQHDKAVACWQRATTGSQTPEPVRYYNDQPSDYIFYQGLAFRALGEEENALRSFHQLVIYGEQHLFDKVEYDFFAVSMPEIEVFEDDIQLRSTQYCNYLRALGHIGLGERQEADSILDAILNRQVDYQGALAAKYFLLHH